MKRRKRTGLPRLSLLAFSSKELREYVEATERLHHLVDHLDQLVKELRVKKAPRSGPRKVQVSDVVTNGQS